MANATEIAAWWASLLEAGSGAPVWAALVGGIVALVSAVVLTPLIIRLAHRRGWVSRPRENRWHQRRTVALMGGIAIFGAVVLAVVVAGGAMSLTWPVALAGALLFGMGLADDLRGLSPHAKLLTQVLAAVLTIYGGFLFWESGPFWLSGPLTFLWVIGITNAFNLIDGMDGLAAGTATIAACTLAVIAVRLGLPGLAALAAIVAGAAAGFLAYNTHPARVFMGDSGSLFLGYALAAVALGVQSGNVGPSRPGAVLVPAVVLAVPIFDVILVTVLRVANGRRITEGGTDHSMHRLAVLGLSERQTVLLLYGVSAVLGAVTLLLYTNTVLLFSALVLAATGALVILASYLSRADVYADETKAEAPRRMHEESEQAQTFTAKFGAVMHELIGRYWKQVGGLLADTLVVLSALIMAHVFRFPAGMPDAYQAAMLQALPLVAGVKVSIFYAMGIYHRLWPRAGTPEMVHLGKAVLLTSALTIAGMHAAYGSDVVSASALGIDMLLTGVGISVTRFGFRALRQYIVHKQRGGLRVVICGAGAEGILALRSLNFFNREQDFHVIGFLDDNDNHQGYHVKGLPVLGKLQNLEAVCERHDVDGVAVNTALHSDAEVEAIHERCRTLDRTCYRVRITLDVLTDGRGTPRRDEQAPQRDDGSTEELEVAGTGVGAT
jgi:UDP-GlcNAc:undecaprenyl-phosphate GlcNAc-1-phosphate transferase